MPLDHFVSQVHLKNFGAESLGGRLHAQRKSDGKAFTPRTKDICRIPDGSSNQYLTQERVIEEFLKEVEPRYNASIQALESGEFDARHIYAIAGFVAYFQTCSPTGMRMFVPTLQETVKTTANLLEQQGLLPPPPPELGGATLSDLLAEDKVRIDVDEKYPQAIGIGNVLALVRTYGNARWELLVNEESESPFFTSDFPMGIEGTLGRIIQTKVVPLTPRLAVRILPDPKIQVADDDYAFRKLEVAKRTAHRQEVMAINTLLVRCAEDEVYYCKEKSWIPKFIAKNSGYRLESDVQTLPHGRGYLTVTTYRLRNRITGRLA